MLVVMQSHAAASEIDKVVEVIKAQGLTPHVMPGATRTAIGMTGNTGAVDKSLFEVLAGVEEAIRVTKPYKLASREMKRDDTDHPARAGDHRAGDVHDRRRAVLGRERGDDAQDRRVPGESKG